MSTTKQQRLAKGLRWAARVIGLLTVAFSLMFLIGDTVIKMAMQQDGLIEDVLTAMPVIVVVAGCIVSWWRQWLTGTLLVLASFALSSLGSRYYGFPYLVAGLLFLWSCPEKHSLLRQAHKLRSPIRDLFL